jgi:uncharacterized protein YfiM (DUF2279 family)
LLGRYDSAQHFVISAALAAWAGEPAANAIGVYKEIDDSRRGSGFSFADLAADRAGTRFGEVLAWRPGNASTRPCAGRCATAIWRRRWAVCPEYLSAAQLRAPLRRPGQRGLPAS